MISKKESFKQSVIIAGFKYAKFCFENLNGDPLSERLEDGRVDPNYIDIYDAAGEILGGCPEDFIELDKNLFPEDYSREDYIKLMIELLDNEAEYYFIEGERQFIDEVYGDDWEN